MESENRLRFVLIDDLEIVGSQIGDWLATGVERYRIEADERARRRSLRQKGGHGPCECENRS